MTKAVLLHKGTVIGKRATVQDISTWTLIKEDMRRGGKMFLSRSAFYDGANPGNKRKCICLAENIFRVFLIAFFFSLLT